METPSHSAPAISSQWPDIVRAACDRHAPVAGGLMPLLHEIQDHLGCIPPQADEVIAKAMNLSRAEVHGVVSFYHHFRRQPVKGKLVQVCRAESCRACGSDELWEAAMQKSGENVTVVPVYCLGLCASSPAVQIGDRCHARVSPQRLERLLGQQESAA